MSELSLTELRAAMLAEADAQGAQIDGLTLASLEAHGLVDRLPWEPEAFDPDEDIDEDLAERLERLK